MSTRDGPDDGAAAGPVARTRRLAGTALVRGVDAWRRSIQLRVVATTLLLSVVVVALLGALLLRQVTEGLLDAKTRTSLSEARSGFTEAQQLLRASNRTDPANLGDFLSQLVSSLASSRGQGELYDVVLLASPTVQAGTSRADDAGATVQVRGPRFSGGVRWQSVPSDLRRATVSRDVPAYTYTELSYLDGSTVPGLAVGRRVSVPNVGTYELYYLFRLTQERETLSLVRRTVVTAGLLLVLLLGAIAFVVTRQVVTPVRMAARTSERLAAGDLSERMVVRGKDDLALLASSFNLMATNLQRQIRQLEELSRLQQRFVSDVSHELRTPLTTVRMAADVLHEARGGFEPAVARSAELLSAQLDRFESLLVDLLEISRFDAGAAHLEREQVDLRALVQRVVEGALPIAAELGTELLVRVPPDPCVADVDPRRVERIVRNLIVNAVEHALGRPVLLRVGCDARAVAVVVRDQGVGLRPGESSLVFNRFWRADPARARRTGGTGLGLSIALEDAHLHGGWLQAWGESGVGAQFRLTLPRRAGDEIDSSPLPLVPDGPRPLPAAPVGARGATVSGASPGSGPARG